MKCITLALLVLSVFSSATLSAARVSHSLRSDGALVRPRQFGFGRNRGNGSGRFGGGGGRNRGGGGGGNNGGGGGGNNNSGSSAAADTTSAAAAATTSAAPAAATTSAGSSNGNNNNANGNNGNGNNGNGNNNNGNGNNGNNGNNGGGDAQTSLTLLDSQVQPGLAKNGQETPTAGQVASLTSTNNFINFCATQGNLPLTNGLQTKTGSCNPTPMGVILATTKMPASKFVNPPNAGTIKANQDFTIEMAIQNIVTGNFVNAQANYYSAPAQVDGSGTLIGHSHVVIQKIASMGDTNIADPLTFAFFKGLNEAAQGGVLSTTVTGGLPKGTYRLASINTAANHQPALVAVAQHGSLDDMVYFSVA